MKTLATLLCALFVCLTASAQPLLLGDSFPLTNTRYGTADGLPELASNGRDVFMIWPTQLNIRMTKLVEGERRGGRAILPMMGDRVCCSIVWTGSHFLVAATESASGSIVGRLLDRNGEPMGQPFRLVERGKSSRLAFNGNIVVMLHSNNGLFATALSPDGRVLHPSVALPTTPDDGFLWPYDITATAHGFTAITATTKGVSLYHLDPDGRDPHRQNVATLPSGAKVAIAANATRSLIAWTEPDGVVKAAALESDGTLSAPMLVQGPQQGDAASDLAVVWSGTTWVIAHVTAATGSSILRIAHVDSLGRRIVATEPDIARASAPKLAVARDRVVASWRERDANGFAPVYMSTLPLGVTDAEAVTYAAAEQTLLASATSASGTLLVWQETVDGRTSIHSGVRMLDGTWSEREIAEGNVWRARAASNGQEFMVTLSVAGAGATAMRLDDRGRVLSSNRIALDAGAIVWIGNTYVIASGSNEGLQAAKLSAGGALSSMTFVHRRPAIQPSLAWSGTNLLLVWLETEQCPVLCIEAYQPKAMRIGKDLQAIDANELFGPDVSISDEVAAAWSGTEYIVAVGMADAIETARIPATGTASPRFTPLFVRGRTMNVADITPFDGGVAIAWTEWNLSTRTADHGVAILRESPSAVHVVHHDSTRRGEELLETLPDGRLAHFASLPQYAAPHHGSSRIAMTFADVAPRAAPAPPSITAALENGRIRLDWNAGAQDIAGYRIEYRIGDGSWNELEPWFAENERTTTLRWNLRRTTYAFRARAVNAAGPGAYSAITAVHNGKTRAVR